MILRSSTTATKWSMPLPKRNGFQAQVEQSSRYVLCWYDGQVHENKFSLTPRRIPVERKTPAAKRGVDQDTDAKEESVSDAENGWSGVSDNSTDSECTDVVELYS